MKSQKNTPYTNNQCYTVIQYQNKDVWREGRFKGIGSSDSSTVLGLNPYKNTQQLYREKKGIIIPEDISDKDFVRYGIEAEEHLRKLFELDFPEYTVYYQPDTILQRNDKEYLLASPDGMLIDKDNRLGVLEIKTTNILQSLQKEKWKDGHLPDNYYIQCLHQLLVSGADYVCLKAQLKYKYGNDVSTTCKHYWIERSDVEEDLKYLEQELTKFWEENILKNKEPDLVIHF